MGGRKQRGSLCGRLLDFVGEEELQIQRRRKPVTLRQSTDQYRNPESERKEED